MGQNLFSPQTQWGASLAGLVDSLYSGDGEGKRAERDAKIAQQQQDTALKAAKIADYKAKREAEASRGRAEAENISNVVAAASGGAPQGKAVMDYRNAGGVQPNPSPAIDDEGNDYPQPPTIPMDRPTGYTPQAEASLNRVLTGIFGTKALGGKNFEQAMKGSGEVQNQNMIADVVAGLTPRDTVAGAVRAGKGGAMYQDHGGRVLDVTGGRLGESGPQAVASVNDTNKQAAERAARANLYGAQSGKVRSETLPQVQVPAPAGLTTPTGTVPARGIDVGKAAVAGSAAGKPGVGDKAYQDPTTGKVYQVNERTGKTHLRQEDGTMLEIDPAMLPKNVQKIGSIGTAGARENVFTGRIGTAAGQATADLENIVKLPRTASTGLFGGRKQGPGLLDATKDVLANKVTSQEGQSYNVRASGLQRNLAAIEAAGLMPSGSLTHQMDAVMWREGDTEQTKLEKLAQTRQIVDAGLAHALENPRISDSEKAKLREYRERMGKAVPFAHADIDSWVASQEASPETTFDQFLKSRKRRSTDKAPAPAAGGVKFLGFED